MLTARNVELNVGLDISNVHQNKVHPAPIQSPRDPLAQSRSVDFIPLSPQKKLTFSDATVPDGSNQGLGRQSIKATWAANHVPKLPSQSGVTFLSKAPLTHPDDDAASSQYGLPELDEEGEQAMHWWGRLPIIMPHDPRYMAWWYLTMAVSLITAALDPYRLAFVDSAGLYPYNDAWAVLEYVAVIIFVVDMTSKFFLAFSDPEVGLETRHNLIAVHYLRLMFWVDLLATFPIDGVVAAGLGLTQRTDTTGLWLGCVRWLRLARLYRIFDFFQMLEHKMVVSQVTLILLRNNLYVAYITHWFACLMFWVATMENYLDSPSWVGRSADRMDGQSPGIKYLYSLYFSVGAFAGLGDNDFFCASPVESLIMIFYLLFNIVLQAYILGTITMVMVKGDEKSRAFRDRIEALRHFTKVNELPASLSTAMREHIELQFLRDQASDEQVLQDYPATLKRKALRHLYAHCLTSCPLLRGTRGRFLDQLLVVCRSEMFMPHVSLLQDGDVVSELMLIVEGEAKGVPAGHHLDMAQMRRGGGDIMMEMHKSFAATGANARRRSSIQLNNGSVNGSASNPGAPMRASTSELGVMSNHFTPRQGRGARVSISSQQSGNLTGGRHASQTRRDSALLMSLHSEGSRASHVQAHLDAEPGSVKTYGPSDCIGAVPFMTDTSSTESVYTTAMTRVLIISKSTYDSLSTTYPQQVRVLLENLRDMAEEDYLQELEDASMNAGADPEETEKLKSALASGQSFSISGGPNAALDGKIDFSELAASLTPHQRARLEQLDCLRKTVNDFCRKQKALRVYEFLLAAATGDLETMRNLMQQGVKPSSCDYDRRTALMVAAHEGQDAVVRFLLSYYVALGVKDAYGNTALSEAVLQGHDHVMKLLLDAGAPLGMEPLEGFGAICRTIIEGDMQGLRRLLQAGAAPGWAGYDGRSGLHVAASEGNLQAVQVLVELGHADPNLKDKWGCTPIEDAEEAGHFPIVEYLTSCISGQETEEAEKKGIGWRNSDLAQEYSPFAAQDKVQEGDHEDHDDEAQELPNVERLKSVKSYASTASTRRRRPPRKGLSCASLASLSPQKSMRGYRLHDYKQATGDYHEDDDVELHPHNSKETGRARRMSVRMSVDDDAISLATSRGSVPTSVVLSPKPSQATTAASKRTMRDSSRFIAAETLLINGSDSGLQDAPAASPGPAAAESSPRGIRGLDSTSAQAADVESESLLSPLFVQAASTEGLAMRSSQPQIPTGAAARLHDAAPASLEPSPFVPKHGKPLQVPALNLSQVNASAADAQRSPLTGDGSGVRGSGRLALPHLPFPTSMSSRLNGSEDGPGYLRIASLDPTMDMVPASALRQPVILDTNSSFSAKLPALDHKPQPQQPHPARSNLMPRTLDPLDAGVLRGSAEFLEGQDSELPTEQGRLVGNVTRAALPELDEET